MIGVGTSLLFGRKAGKAGPPIPPFNKAMVDAHGLCPVCPMQTSLLLSVVLRAMGCS